MYVHEFFRRHPLWMTSCLVVVAIASCVNVGMAFVVQALVSLVTSGELAAHPEAAWVAVAYLVPWALTEYAWVAFTYHLVGRYQADIRLNVMDQIKGIKVPRLSRFYHNPDAFRSGIVNDAGLIGADYFYYTFRITYDVVTFVATIIATGLIDPSFIPFVLGLSLVSAILPKFAQKRLSEAQRRTSDRVAVLIAEASRITDGMESLVSCRCAERAWQALVDANEGVRRAFVHRLMVRTEVYTLSVASGKLVTYGIWALGALAVAQGSMDLAKLVALAQLMTVLQDPIQEISPIYSDVISNRALVKKIKDLSQEEELDDGEDAAAAGLAAPAPADGLACEGLTVAAEGGGEVLSGARLAVPAGARVLVEGPSGAGKTTLLRALAGTAAASGAVWLGGEPLGPAEDRAGRVCLVTQAAFRAAPDLAGCMDPGGSGDALAAAREAASAWPGVLGPLAARLAEDPRAPASSLSGGEARRLHLLRGLLATPEALLLDEACAGLDPASAAAALSEANASAAPVVLSVVHDLPADPASLGFTHRVRVEGGRVGPLEPL
ncbi:ABC transporter ATP-binding protein [Coriobacteriaceae bacterium]|uniref:ABC transmembrane type-1 domain-containing protein n=1 Tax=Granulimonas faecalis TaxID=2894155 RepID=A0AAV5B711_9ACTN|nr:ABC transporter ATP-binding protein [Coriobacteriaceae bacterium]GJM55938.1 hypothetical protein ATOP_15930 [Granulimonas faecalis]